MFGSLAETGGVRLVKISSFSIKNDHIKVQRIVTG